ncbi:hypothetical protein L9F63_016302, partial [Diploptera punctata]
EEGPRREDVVKDLQKEDLVQDVDQVLDHVADDEGFRREDVVESMTVREKYKGTGTRASVIAKKGAEIWKSMSCEQEQEYMRQACETQKKCKKGKKGRRHSSSKNKYQCS